MSMAPVWVRSWVGKSAKYDVKICQVLSICGFQGFPIFPCLRQEAHLRRSLSAKVFTTVPRPLEPKWHKKGSSLRWQIRKRCIQYYIPNFSNLQPHLIGKKTAAMNKPRVGQSLLSQGEECGHPQLHSPGAVNIHWE